MSDYRNRPYILDKDPMLNEALEDIVSRVHNVRQQMNVSENGPTSAPPNVQSLQVISAQGIFDAAISDNASNVSRGINYFLEYSLSPAFTSPIVIDLGSARNWRGFLGNQLLYWRSYSAYPTSQRSSPVYYGTQQNPTGVMGGGTSAGPAPLPSSGSGTSSGGGGNDGGFGNEPYRGSNPPQL